VSPGDFKALGVLEFVELTHLFRILKSAICI
jgi:hypothetical protein